MSAAMETMVEKMAKTSFYAGLDRIGYHGEWHEAPQELRERMRSHARKVLAGMREPSEAMVSAGSAWGDWPFAGQTWQNMIDAAIEEDPE